MAIDNEDMDGSEELNSEQGTYSNDYSVDSESDEEVVESETRKGSEELLDSKVRKQLVPKIGMEFETEEQAYQFYKAYAFTIGFNVRRSKQHTENGKVVDRVFVCSAEGKRGEDKRDANVKCRRAETRFGCLAKMKISCRAAEKYRVTEFVYEHTHLIIKPRETRFFKSHRIVPVAQIAGPELADSDTSGNSPKARRYRELCRLFKQIATRASKSEKTYEIVVSGLTKMLEEIDACLKEEASQEPSQLVSPTNSASGLTEPIAINDNINVAGGIKTKAKPVGASKGPENAPAKVTQKRKRASKELEPSSGPSTQSAARQASLGEVRPKPMMDLMPPHMRFSPFQFPQHYYIGTQTPISNIYQQSRSSLVNSLQAHLPSEKKDSAA